MRLLKQSTAYNWLVFMTDSADHVTGKTGLTLTITLSKDGGAFSSISPTVTERSNGWYNVALTTSHTDTVGDIAMHITGTGCDPSDVVGQVRANVLGDTLPANVIQVESTDATDYFATLDDAVLSALSTISTTLSTISGYIDTEVAAIKVKTDNLPSDPADQSAVEAAIAAAKFDPETALVETGVTYKQALQRIGATTAGKASGAGSGTETFKGLDGTTDRVEATVDNDGNRTGVTYDP